MTRARWTTRTSDALLVAVVLYWTALLGGWRGGGAAVTGIVLVAVTPLVAGLAALAARRSPLEARPAGGMRLARRLLLGVAWLPLLAGAALWTLLTEPWPLSLRHGPDTDAAREAFADALGYAAPPGLHDLYARRAWGGPGEEIVYVAFRFDDPAVLDELARRLGLARVEPAEVPGLDAFDGPSWWPSRSELAGRPEGWRRTGSTPQAFVHLWVDRVEGRAWLQDADAL